MAREETNKVGDIFLLYFLHPINSLQVSLALVTHVPVRAYSILVACQLSLKGFHRITKVFPAKFLSSLGILGL